MWRRRFFLVVFTASFISSGASHESSELAFLKLKGLERGHGGKKRNEERRKNPEGSQRFDPVVFVVVVPRNDSPQSHEFLRVPRDVKIPGEWSCGRNKLICDCKLAWIWGLRNETKNIKLRNALEELTCFLESNNATLKINSEDLERNQALEIARNPEEYLADNLREGNGEEDGSYMGDVPEDYYDDIEDGYADSSVNSNSQPKVQMVEGKLWYVKHLFDLKLEELPCPEPSREDLMASEQPSSRHENAPVGSSGSIWFTGAGTTARPDFSALAYSLVLLLSMLFT
ncbi:hypothetical protein KM043_018481 [Ampulex compressa]|nr:hypothetical protein KM043_018481 [Ampulex compressa]